MASRTHEFEQAPGDSEEQGGLTCCSPWGCNESGTTERLNNSSKLYRTSDNPPPRETGKEKGKWGRGKEQEKEYEKEVTDAKDCEKKQSIVRNASEW